MIQSRPLPHVCYQDRAQAMQVPGKSWRYGRSLGRVLCSTALTILMAVFALAAPRPKAPDDRAVTKLVDEYFASLPGYEKGDLITRSQIEKVIAKLVSRGVKISDSASIVKLGLADDSFLVRELSTPDGKRFMRKIASRSG